jgi:hypothetical protein
MNSTHEAFTELYTIVVLLKLCTFLHRLPLSHTPKIVIVANFLSYLYGTQPWPHPKKDKERKPIFGFTDQFAMMIYINLTNAPFIACTLTHENIAKGKKILLEPPKCH